MTSNIERRGLMATAVATALATRAATAAESAVMIETKPMAFDPKSIPGLSENILRSHYDNNYSGAVKRLNTINEQLSALDFAAAANFTINGLKREQLVAMNSMILHEIYFAGLGQGGEPAGQLAAAIEQSFGAVAKWRAEFTAMGKALGGGSGWVLLSYSARLKRLINVWAADHTMTGADGVPILALDMYEHAYHMDFGAKAGAYVDAYMKAINWGAVASAYKATSG
jgi:superoxide dismutase, Fe-Mn family